MSSDSTFRCGADHRTLHRREWLSASAASLWCAGAANCSTGSVPNLLNAGTADEKWPPVTGPRKAVAGVLTTYFQGSHSDVLIGRLLKGWKYDGGPGPALKLASLYIDQTSNTEYGRRLAAEFGIPVFETIEAALTAGGAEIAVDGVLSVGEHGDYPRNELGQDLYPRRRFFEEITATFEKHGRVVPVFNDKHLGPRWLDALWMYERARKLRVPLMAGSSLVVGYRTPDVNLPADARIDSAVAIGYSELDRYGIHTLEFLQSFAERRRGGESGVCSVRCVSSSEIPALLRSGRIPEAVFRAAADVAIRTNGSDLLAVDPGSSAGFLIDYSDGLQAAALMLNGTVGSISAAVRLQEGGQILASRAEERPHPHHPHFAFLLHAVERMIHSGRATYPVERTLLTSGLLDRLLTSRQQGGRELLTPELAIAYQSPDYPHAPNPPLPV